jgi:DNA-binding GntR family transcriptional regulator
MTTRRTATPPGQRIAADLRARLASGEWADGDVLPTGRELADHYGGVSQPTVSRVMRQLAEDGLVHTVGTWATVAGPAGAEESFDNAG